MFPRPCKAPTEVQEIKELAQAGRVGSSWPEVTRETPGEAEDRPSLHVRRHLYLVHELGKKHSQTQVQGKKVTSTASLENQEFPEK